MKLKTGLFFAKMGKYGSVGGIVLQSFALILIHNIGQDPTMGLLAMAFYLVNYYLYTTLVEHIEDRIRENKEKK